MNIKVKFDQTHFNNHKKYLKLTGVRGPWFWNTQYIYIIHIYIHIYIYLSATALRSATAWVGALGLRYMCVFVLGGLKNCDYGRRLGARTGRRALRASSQDASKTHLILHRFFDTHLHRFWEEFRSQVASQNPPKFDKIDAKMPSEVDVIFKFIFDRFSIPTCLSKATKILRSNFGFYKFSRKSAVRI